MPLVKDKARADALSIGFFQEDLLYQATETGSPIFFQNGTYEWLIWGTWGGATAQLQQAPTATGPWIDFNDVNTEANGRMTGIPIAKSWIRVNLTNTTEETSLTSTFTRTDR